MRECVAHKMQTEKALVTKWEEALGWGRHTQGILQHHDAITGTGGGACDAEYHTMLRNATELCRQVIANTTSSLLPAGVPINMSVAYTPPIPPTTLPENPLSPKGHMCAEHAHGSAPGGYVDCQPHPGGEAQCHKIGCCWVPSPAHPFCYKPSNSTLPPQGNSSAPLMHDWPIDGTVLELGGDGRSVAIIASNPLAWNRTEVLTLRVRSVRFALYYHSNRDCHTRVASCIDMT